MSEPRDPWGYPDCPDCEGHLFVDYSQSNDKDFVCHNCDVRFDDSRRGGVQ
jgi:hypothetical protein